MAFGLTASVVAFLVAAVFIGGSYVASGRWTLYDPPADSLLTAGDALFLAGSGLGIFLAFEINGRWVITRGIVSGLSLIWPLAKYTAIVLVLWYVYKKYIRGPDIQVQDDGSSDGS